MKKRIMNLIKKPKIIFEDDKKKQIIDLFNINVRGKEIILKNKKHCGSEGHWLEKQMGLKLNSNNSPDINGYEMKKNSGKITFGDFSATEYLFSKKKSIITKNIDINRNQFIRYFGTPNPLKDNRYSWSGSCVPKYNIWNSCGQIILFNRNNDLCIYYSFRRDRRNNKQELPDFIKKENELLIAIWKEEKLKNHINKKFNINGFFICKKINNTYQNICFGKPFNFNYFVENIKNKSIIFDSGMYEGNSRNYSQFRSSLNGFWNSLIVEEY